MATKKVAPKDLLDSLRTAFGGPEELDEPRPLEQILLLILARGSDIRKARTAMKRLQSEYVDWNEVRVTSAYELRRWLSGMGARKSQAKAEQVKELLSTVYNRFNKLNLDFLHAASDNPDETRKRDRFQTYLEEKSLALSVMMTLHGSPPGEIVVTAGLPRLLQRLGVLNGKTGTITAARSYFKVNIEPDFWVSCQWGLYHVLEQYCHSRAPDCPDCPLLKRCPTGKEEAKKRLKREAEAAKKAKAAAKKAATIRKAKAAPAKKVTKKPPAAKASGKKVAKKKTAKKVAKKGTAPRGKTGRAKTSKKAAGRGKARRR